MATTNQDIFKALPLEIAQRCIAEACKGKQYMASLLIFTMVSSDWCRILMETPTLWAIIHINDADQDSMSTIALFLHLARDVHLSLSIWIPLSRGWDIISPMILPRRDHIQKITVRTHTESHSTECRFKMGISDATILHNLQKLFDLLYLPTSIKYLDIILDRPVSMDLTWMPPNLASTGNWLIPSWILDSPSNSFPRLRYLSMKAIELPALLPHLSVLGQLQHLHLHSEEQDYIDPPPLPSATNVMDPLSLPFLNTLEYHGRLYGASMQLLRAAAQTIQTLDLYIGVLDLNVAVTALEVGKFLRCFSLTLLWLEYDLDANKKPRSYQPMSITNLTSRIETPKWRLPRLENFRCEMKSLRSDKMSGNIDLDHLWRLFHVIFPELRVLVWHLPIQSDVLLVLLFRQKQLKHFESNISLAPSSRQLTGIILYSLVSLRIKDALMFRGMVIPNLLHISATCRENFIVPAGIKFTQLRSLDLEIGQSIETLDGITNGDLPVLEVLSVTFLSPSGGLPVLDFPSLTEITISTKLPTFSQGMKFCASLLYEPWKCPRLERINLDSFLEWGFLCLLLRRRNFLQRISVSRIKTLSLPFLPPRFRPILAALLDRQCTPSLSFFWGLMARLSLQGAQSRLLDQHVTGCFNCVYWGLGDCSESLQPSRLPRDYRDFDGEDGILGDIIEPLGLFPLYSLHTTRPMVPVFWIYENIWIIGYQKRAEGWRKKAFAWSKLHYRPLTCHKWCCNSNTTVTEYDMERDKSDLVLSSPAFKLAEHVESGDTIGATIPSLLELLQDQDSKIRPTATSKTVEIGAQSELRNVLRTAPSLVEILQNKDRDLWSSTTSRPESLVTHVELCDVIEAVIPSLVELLKSDSSFVQSTTASASATLAEHAKFLDLIHASIPLLIGLLRVDNPDIRSASASALAKLTEHAEFRNDILAAIPLLVDLLKNTDSEVQSVASSSLSKLVAHAEFCNDILASIPSFVYLLKNTHAEVRSTAASALVRLAKHAEFGNEIRTAIPSLFGLLENSEFDVRNSVASTLAQLEKHVEFRNVIHAAIPSLVELLQDEYSDVRSSATSALSTLAQHPEFRNEIRAAIPSLFELLLHSSFDTRSMAASTLAKMGDYAEFRNAVHPAIPSLIWLLNDGHSNVRSTAASALAKLAEHAEFRNEIRAAIPSLLELLLHNSFDTRSMAASTLAKMGDYAEFRNAVHPAITSLIGLLGDEISNVRSVAASALAKLAEHAEFRNAVHPAIKSLIGLLGSGISNVQPAAVSALSTLAEHAEFRNGIRFAIPRLVGLLKKTDSETRSTAASALVRLAEHAEFTNEILAAIPLLVDLLKDTDSEARSTATSVLARLAEHAEFRNEILAAIPLLVDLIKNTDSGVRSTAASAIVKLAKHAEFGNEIRTAIPSLLELLENSEFNVRNCAASTLVQLEKHTEIRNAIHAAICSTQDIHPSAVTLASHARVLSPVPSL